jgi:hypothetical protein
VTKILKGSCLCGAVSYEASGEPVITGHCHCFDCRKTSGTGHCTHVAMRAEGVRLTGAMSSYRRPAASGNIVERFFCPGCGAPIHSTNLAMPGMVFLRASSLDDPDQVTPQMVVYASRAPKWDMMDTALPAYPEFPEGGPAAVIPE